MKRVSAVSRYLTGLMFTVFGLNGVLDFTHQPPPTNPLALQFFTAISSSHFAALFFTVHSPQTRLHIFATQTVRRK